MNVRNYAIQCIKDEAEALMGLIPLIDDNFDNAVELMFRCHG
ncbi:MAG: KpsF/GutQ family sugar-phosphate isomerase, partial [Prevotellaceae bacterium]|nr:KpsF/GutQ family sugar-phosphate isomerase [Prevotellaceae bacterium]